MCLEKNLYVNETVNIGSDHEIDMNELAELVRKLVNPDTPITRLPALPEGDMRRRKPDNSRMREALGRNLVSLSDGILKTAEFQRSRA
jgi:UDP-glucose 4-epimerase